MNGCLFFDFDGTLLDTRRVLTASVNFVRELHHLRPLSDQNIASCFGGDMNLVLDRALAGISGIALPEAHEQLQQHYLQYFAELAEIFPGVPTGLAELNAVGFSNIVLTDRPVQLARQVLAQYDLLHCFESIREIRSGENVERFLRTLLEECGAGAECSGILTHHGERLAAGGRIGLHSFFAKYSFFDPPGQKSCRTAGTFTDFAQEMILKKLSRLA